MKKKIHILSVLFLLVALSYTSTTQAQTTRDDLRSDFGIELLGKAAVYSFSYQRMLSSSLGLQAGLSAIGSNDASVIFLPLGVNYYPVQKNGSPMLSAGLTILTGISDAGPLEGGTYGYVGGGFEFRAPGGLLFRGQAYALLGGGGFFIWPGLHVGYAF